MIIPVVDMKNGTCVSGKSGMRDTYQKLSSIYGDNPLMIAENLKKRGFSYLYIADLDKIEGVGENSQIISRINDIIPVLLDDGIGNVKDLKENMKISSFSILATETIESIKEAEDIIKIRGKENIIISIDIKDNQLLIKNNDIYMDDIISLINRCQVKHVIILNISNVGTKNSQKTNIQDKVLENTPDANYIIAGGLTNHAIEDYIQAGIDNFLVGTILHEGNMDEKYI